MKLGNCAWNGVLRLFGVACLALAGDGSAVADSDPGEARWRKSLIVAKVDLATVARAKGFGYDGLEIRLGAGMDETCAAAARQLAAREGVAIHSAMGDGWYAFEDPAKFEAEVARAKRDIALAAAYGADTLLVACGARRPGPKRYVPLSSEEQAALDGAVRRAFAELLPVASGRGVVLALEFVWNGAWTDPDAYAAFVRSFGSPWVRCYMDVGNVLKYAPVEKWISAAGDMIRRVHIKDFLLDPTTARGGEFVPIGKGSLDYAAVKRALDAAGYRGWVTIESFGWNSAQHAELVDWFFSGAAPAAKPRLRAGDVSGRWTLDLPFNDRNVGWFGASRSASGEWRCNLLWRWASPWQGVDPVERDGVLSFRQGPPEKAIPGKPYAMVEAKCPLDREDEIVVTWQSYSADGSPDGKPVVARGRLIPPPGPKPDLSNIRFGSPVDLLADGLDGWRSLDPDRMNGWSFSGGVLSNRVPRDEKGNVLHPTANIATKRADFYDFTIDYDIMMSKGGNSGLYLRGIYEIQANDTFGRPVDSHNMGALYARIAPSVAVERPAGEWQHVTATIFRRHVTVVLNGIRIIDNEPVYGVTGGALTSNEFVPGPIYLQGDHSDAAYRNMILRPVLSSAE